MAYRAEIEIAVKGARELTNLTKQLEAADSVVNRINKNLTAKGLFTGSIENLRIVSAAAERTMRSATAGTYSQKQAIDVYVKSLANAEKAERNLAVAIKQRQRELGIRPTSLGAGRGAGGGRVGGIVSNAVIGGAFPLLFGQGGGAATGGAIGGAVGGLFGGAGGFAGSLLGTLIGERAGRGTQIKELAADIGFTAEQTKMLGTAFQQAGADFDKFQASVQNIRGLSLSVEDQADAIRLVSELTDTYGGKIDKVTVAFADALESGKVSQATLNQLTGQGIPIQEELARKYGVSRDAILQMAKDGKISVQSLADVLVDMGNKGLEAGEKSKSAFDRFSVALGNTSTAVGNVAATLLNVLTPAIDTVIVKATQALNILTETINTELLRTQVQARSGKIVGPAKLKEIEAEAMSMAAGRFPSQAKGRQLAAGAKIISPQAQAEFQIIREQLIRNELQRFGFESGILKAPKPTLSAGIGRITAPSQVPPSGGGGGGEGDKAARDAAREAERVAKLLRDTEAQTALLRIQAGIQDRIFQAEQARDPLLAARLKGEEEIISIQAKYTEILADEPNIKAQAALVTKGLQEIENVRLKTAQELEQIETERLDKYNALIEDLNLELELKNLTSEQDRERLRIEFEINRLRKDNIYSEEQLFVIQQKRLALSAQDSPGQKRMKELSTSLAELTNTESIAVAAADNIGQAFGNAFQDIITGAASGQEALANMMKSIGENFVNMAAQIIAQQMTMIILGTIMKALGLTGGLGSMGGGGGFGSFSGGSFGVDSTGLGGGLTGGNLLGGGGMYSGIKFAEGGFVTGPTQALIGEAGESEYVIPASKMSGAMARYSAGARGNAVIPAEGGEGISSMSIGAPTGAIDVRYSVERINSVDYVTADQFQRGMAQAAQQGAKQGEQMTLRRLQQSRSTRGRLGLN